MNYSCIFLGDNACVKFRAVFMFLYMCSINSMIQSYAHFVYQEQLLKMLIIFSFFFFLPLFCCSNWQL